VHDRSGAGLAQDFNQSIAMVRTAQGCPQPLRDELFLLSKKPFQVPDATVLKPLSGIDCANDASARRIQGVQTNQTVSK
jgi:hypothetical protein